MTKKPPSGKVIYFKEKIYKAIKEALGLDRDIQKSDMLGLISLDFVDHPLKICPEKKRL
ncbi:hypothetical protein [Cytobacillus oceanisediminis]|nr:hypothetical protein [Cytobacillus oceanisediminis]